MAAQCWHDRLQDSKREAMIDLRRRLAIPESVVCAELADETVLLNIETGIYFGLDHVGTHIWRLLAEGREEEEILAALEAEYEVEPVQLRADVAAFLDLLMEKGLARQGAE